MGTSCSTSGPPHPRHYRGTWISPTEKHQVIPMDLFLKVNRQVNGFMSEVYYIYHRNASMMEKDLK